MFFRRDTSKKENAKKWEEYSSLFLLLFDEVAHHSGLPLPGVLPGRLVGVEAFDDLSSADNVETGGSGLVEIESEHNACLSALLGGSSWAPLCALLLSI